MKKFINHWFLILLVLILFGFLFYWFQVRPSNIRSKCANEVYSWIKEKSIKTDQAEAVTVRLNLCLYKNGLSR